MCRHYWITRAEGPVVKVGEKTYSNAKYVEMLTQETGGIALLALAKNPTATTVKILGCEPPSSWVDFRANTPDIAGIISRLEKVDLHVYEGEGRLRMQRGEISDNVRALAKYAGVNVTGRGIVDAGVPTNTDVLLEQLVAGIMIVIEKTTTASIRAKKTTLAPKRMQDFMRIVQVIEDPSLRFIDCLLVNAYVEPSPLLTMRYFIACTAFGREVVDVWLRDIFHQAFSLSIASIISASDILGVEEF